MAEPADSAAAGPSRPSHPPPVDPDADLRLRLREATHKATRRDPYDWQLDIAVALCRGRDVLCLSPTGSGKTLAFVMPCFVEPRTLVWIVSPLNYIEQQQARVFRDDWHLDAVAVNATTSYPGLHKVRRRVSLASQRLAEATQDISNGKYRVIISSPEQLLEYNKLRPLVIQLAGQGYKHVVVVDECHCICVWSENFRKMYGLIGSLRTFLLPGTPFCAATATATQSMKKQILSSLHYTDSYLPINRGYWKPNLSWHIYYMYGSNSSVGEVTQMFPKNLNSESVIPQTIIFVDERGLAFRMMDVLREFLPPELGSQVEVYHALQSQLAKDLTAKRFEKGEIRILICTEALTMVSTNEH
ncbi:ATP-dependent DNA helicase sgs1 [Ceratobasidium sp. 428]|nr:ATP-dependent DNA helicase sgs1 [Ceratobasidium sp. 428]